MLDFLMMALYCALIVLGGLGVAGVLFLLGFYARLWLGNANILWTKVEEGWKKVVLRLGVYQKTLGPGFHWLGWPGVNTLYSRKMVFKKCVINAEGDFTVEDHNDPNITSFKSTVYPYGIPFKDEEDAHGLPLRGMIVAHAKMTDLFKSFFIASDWYLTMILLIVVALRQVLTEAFWEQITGQAPSEDAARAIARKAFGLLLWEAMNTSREGGLPSVVSELKEKYGIEIESVELANIDPPDGWRDTTLAPYKAQKEKEAAVHQAETSHILLSDTRQELDAWKAANPNATPAEIAATQAQLHERAMAKTGGYQQVHVKGLENATTAVVGGGGSGAGVLLGGDKRGKGQGGGGGRKGGQNEGAQLPPDYATMSEEERQAWADSQKRK